MKKLIILFTIVLFSSKTAYSQNVTFEFYTNYGYYTNNDELGVLDGDLYYWFISWNLKDSIYSEKGSSFKADGYVYRIDFKSKGKSKIPIDSIQFSEDNGAIEAIIYPKNTSTIKSIKLIKGADAKSHYIEMCFNEDCSKRAAHSTYQFQDDVYISKNPSQIID